MAVKFTGQRCAGTPPEMNVPFKAPPPSAGPAIALPASTQAPHRKQAVEMRRRGAARPFCDFTALTVATTSLSSWLTCPALSLSCGVTLANVLLLDVTRHALTSSLLLVIYSILCLNAFLLGVYVIAVLIFFRHLPPNHLIPKDFLLSEVIWASIPALQRLGQKDWLEFKTSQPKLHSAFESFQFLGGKEL